MRIAGLMTRNVFTIKPLDPALSAIRLMLEKHISGAPVLNERGDVIGILTESDFLRRVETNTERRRTWLQRILTSQGKLAEEYARSHGHTVADIMTTPVETIDVNSELADAIDLMERKSIKRVPVVSDGKLIGIVSRADILQAVFWRITDPAASIASDATILAQFLQSIRDQPWTSKASLRPEVRNSTVELHGTIFDERERAGLRVLAENIPGVRAVHDHMLLIEPTTGTLISTGEDEASYVNRTIQ